MSNRDGSDWGVADTPYRDRSKDPIFRHCFRCRSPGDPRFSAACYTVLNKRKSTESPGQDRAERRHHVRSNFRRYDRSTL